MINMEEDKFKNVYKSLSEVLTNTINKFEDENKLKDVLFLFSSGHFYKTTFSRIILKLKDEFSITKYGTVRMYLSFSKDGTIRIEKDKTRWQVILNEKYIVNTLKGADEQRLYGKAKEMFVELTMQFRSELESIKLALDEFKSLLSMMPSQTIEDFNEVSKKFYLEIIE